MTTSNLQIGRVRLISLTPDAEQIMGYCARVSNPSNQDNPDVARLMAYCIKHKHWSVFEMANMTLEFDTTRDISAQVLRHKSFSFQEFSTRYAKVTEIEDPHQRRQDPKNRQNSIDDLSEEDLAWFDERWQKHKAEAQSFYNDMLERGFAKETARRILPLCTKTKMYINGNIRSWIHYCQVRDKEGPFGATGSQLEHQELAQGARAIMMQVLPTVSKALEWT